MHHPAPEHIVFLAEQGFKLRPLPGRERICMLLQERLQQHIQLFHAATAQPSQFSNANILQLSPPFMPVYGPVAFFSFRQWPYPD